MAAVAASRSFTLPASPSSLPPVHGSRVATALLYLNPTLPPLLRSFTRARRDCVFLSRCSPRPDIHSDNSMVPRDTHFGASPSTVKTESGTTQRVQPPDAPSSSGGAAVAGSALRGLVLDLSPEHAWDSGEIGSPVVKRFLGDEEERWYMWYHGRSAGEADSDSIGLAVSGNGVHWERGSGLAQSGADAGIVFRCGRDWWVFDTHGVRPSDVLIMSSNKVRAATAVYWLYYTGYTSEKATLPAGVDDDPASAAAAAAAAAAAFVSLPGLAISQDGRHWARIEGEHHSGALFDVGAEGSWDSLLIAAPRVVFHRTGDLRMYYHSLDVNTGCISIGMARSRDGIRWIKLGKIMGGGSAGSFDEAGVMNGHVMMKKDGSYLMAYEGVAATGERSIGVAESEDGLKDWRRCGEGPMLRPSQEEVGWDNKAVGSPCLVRMDGNDDEWRLYYRGTGKGGRSGIGLAVSEGSQVQSFQKWTGFCI